MPIYNVKVKSNQTGQVLERKALDLEALNAWFDMVIAANNPLELSDEKAPNQMTILEYRSVVNTKIMNELNYMVKKALGIIDEPIPEMPEPPEKKPVPKKKEAVKKVEAEPEEPQLSENTENSEDEDIISID